MKEALRPDAGFPHGDIDNIRQPLLAGRQLVAGIWFPNDWTSEQERRKRILKLWRPGSSLFRFSEGELLRLPKPAPFDCETLPGWALRQLGETLASAPIADNEQARLPAADVWLVLGARVISLNFADAEPLDPADWIDLDDYALYDIHDYAASVTAPPIATTPKRDVRDVLGNAVPPPSAERAAFLAQLKARRDDSSSQRTPARAPSNISDPIANALFTLLTPLFRLFGGASRRPGTGHDIPARRMSEVRPQRWRQWLARLAVTTRLSRLLGWRQAAYLRRMLRLFDDGDIREALRHAIPLGGEEEKSVGPAFSTPAPRDDLSLSNTLQSATGIDLGEELNDHLRKLYRNAFQRLDREGRVDEAVFVLAELLQLKRDAIDYLERHDRIAQAAELALSWDFPPDTIVRLLCLAGDWERALLVARRDQAFSAAVALLEKQRPALAQRLRREWANALVAQGEWLTAVEVVWPVAEAREDAGKWLKIAEASDERLAARALVQRAVLLPDTIERYAERLTMLRESPDALARMEFAMALLTVKGKSVAMSRIASAMIPPLLIDRMKGENRLSRNELDRLIKLTNDPLLQADLPALQLPPAPEPIPLQETPTPIEWRAPERGLQPVRDIAILQQDRFLIAQGDAGVTVVDSQSNVLQRYAVTADKLVIGDSRRVALALSKRDTMWRVSRLDMATRHVTDLGVLPLTHFAAGFDGVSWTVVSNNRLLVLDAARSVRDVMWHVSDLPGQVAALSRTPHAEHLVVTTPTGSELWRYQLPGRRLIGRDALPDWPGEGRFAKLTSAGDPVYAMLAADADGELILMHHHGAHSFSVLLPGAPEAPDGVELFVTDEWLMACLSQENNVDWFLVHLKSGKLCGHCAWPNADKPSMVSYQDKLFCFDTGGRILEIPGNGAAARAMVLR